MLRHRAAADGARRAYIFLQDGEIETASLTYAQLDERARAIAGRLQGLAGPGDRALLLYPPGLEFLAAFFGCLYAGVIAVPSYPPKRNRPDLRLQGMAADAGAQIVLTDSSVMEDLDSRLQNTPELKSLRWLATDAPGFAAADAWSAPAVRGGDLAFLQYTSGSTSTPKGVMVSHANLLATLDDLDRGWEHTAESVMVTWLPIFHDMGLIYGALMPLFKGFTCVMLPPPAFLQRPTRWLRAISRYRGTHSAAPNFAYDLCVSSTTPEQRAEFDLRSWCLSLNAAEPVHAETLAAFNEAFAPCGLSPLAVSPGYGLAEASLKVCALPRGEATRFCHVVSEELAHHRVLFGPPGAPGVQTIVGCGWGQIGNRYAIVDPETCRVCPPDTVGEIWFTGPAVAQGYWNRAEETARNFHARLADGGGEHWLRTGDLGFLHRDEIFVTGRLKDLIIIRGLNHYPQDIELTVQKCHPALRPAGGAAFSVDAGGHEALVVAQEIERTHLRKLNVDEVVAAIRQAVAEKHELPVHAVALLRTGSIPKTSSGKIQRRACRALFLDGQLELVGEWRVPAAAPVETGAPADPAPSDAALELTVIETWLTLHFARRLKISPEAVNRDDPFSRYGLDSVAAVELSGELERWLGRHLPPMLLYDYPTIRLLAARLADVASTPDPEGGAAPDFAGGPIAVIGLGCRFPGADSPEAFWRLLAAGGDAVTPVPPARWRPGDTPAPAWGGFLASVDGFDSEFFGLAPREADLMDPQQRLLLEVAWEALEDAGIAPGALAGTPAGVFVGIGINDYHRLLVTRAAGKEAHVATGNALCIAANRLSYLLDLRGPSWAVDTACSSSLVALHQACRSLRAGESNLALVAGVNLLLAPDLMTTLSRAGMLSPDGRCKTFDAGANGYVRGEGCGVVVLKRLASAQHDGDRILAVIRGSAVNQDGRTNGLTAPNGPSQQAVIRAALRDANLVPAAVSYVEAHGTGTSLGDPIEVNSLKEVLLDGRTAAQRCWLGSVKTNIGHLEAAAGIASLIKVVLALRHRRIPPHLNFRELNPLIKLADTPLTIPTAAADWAALDGARYAGISSFGFGGTNAHVIVGEAPGGPPAAVVGELGGHVLVLSARSEPALRALAGRYESYLVGPDAAPWADVCATAALGRAALAHRLAVPALQGAEAAEKLGAFVRGESAGGLRPGVAGRRPRIAFLFSGQGSPYAGMGLELHAASPVYREAFETCRRFVQQHGGWDLAEVVGSAERLAQAEHAQVALFAVEYALARLWISWGVVPDAVLGHSVGEYAAACAAGVFTVEDALRLLLERARLVATLGGTGAMAAVQATEEELADLLRRPGVELGAVNGPRQVVLTGERAAVQAAVADLKANGRRVQLLEVDRPYHSSLLAPMLAPFGEAAARVGFTPPRCAFVSSVTGGTAGADVIAPDYWVRQVRQPVRFAAAVAALHREEIDVLIEVGPRGTLLALGQQVWPAGAGEWLLSLRTGRGDWAQMLESAGRAWVQGAAIDWPAVYRGAGRSRADLPTYPFQRQRHWFDDAPASAAGGSLDAAGLRELAGLLQDVPDLSAADREAAPRILEAIARRRQNLADLNDRRNLVYELRWVARPLAAKPPPPAGAWLLVGELGPLSAAVGDALRRRGHEVQHSDEFLAGNWQGVAFVPGTAVAPEAACAALLALTTALLEARPAGGLWVVTQGAVPALPEDGAGLAATHAALWGFGKVVALEHPEVWGGLVDLPADSASQQADTVVGEILGSDGEKQVAWRGATRFVARLERATLPESAALRLRADGCYWVTGGLGVLGLQVARWLAHHGGRQIVLTGRREPTAEAEQSIAALREEGVSVLTLRADVAEPADVQRVLREASDAFGPVRGVVHAAGVLGLDPIRTMTPESLARVLRPKVAGGWALHEATRALELDFFVLFSSIASVCGGRDQAHYAAANQALDMLAWHRRALSLPALSVNWGPWSGGGMVDAGIQTTLARMGVTTLSSEEALSVLDHLLAGGMTEAMVARVDWRPFRELFELRRHDPLLSALGEGAAPVAPLVLPAEPAPAVVALRTLPAAEVRPRLAALLQEQVAAVLGFKDGRVPDARRGFFELGLDSLMAIELRNRLAHTFARKLPSTLVFDQPNIEALAAYFEESLAGAKPAAAATGTDGRAFPAEGAAPADDLDAELARRLAKLEGLVRKP